MFLGLDLYCKDPAVHLRNLDDLDRDLPNVRKLVKMIRVTTALAVELGLRR